MFDKLQQKWKVNSRELMLILCTFAVTGTLTAWISRQITGWLDVDKYGTAWWLLKIGVLLIGYQLIILAVGFCFGQFRFFWNYEKKILRRLGILQKLPVKQKAAIFASGQGSNADVIIRHFLNHPHISIALIVCNKPGAGVLDVARRHGIDSLLVDKTAFHPGDTLAQQLRQLGIDHIVLAGFLWKIPPALIRAYPDKIINIHPALLPRHGGRGMYGLHVHTAVLAANDAESGITIHYVDEQYDHGSTIFQSRCPVLPGDTPATLAGRVQQLEHTHYPVVIEKWLMDSTQ